MTKLIAMTNDQLTIISNNTNGMQKRQKRLKIIEKKRLKIIEKNKTVSKWSIIFTRNSFPRRVCN